MSGALVNKLSLCNFVTPSLVRSHEWLKLQAPKGLAHLIVASGRAEALDKTLRSLKYHRREGKTVIAIGPVRAGMSTAAARSVSLPEADEQNFFGWPTLADPTRDPDKALVDLKKRLERGADKVLAVVIEPTYLATARSVPETFWAPLRSLCDQFDVPLMVLETTTGGYRNGRGLWRSDTVPVTVDALVYYPGGQLGLGFVSDRFYVAEKLTLISTWDGDELALMRLIWELRCARSVAVAQRATEFRKALQPFGEVTGEGLYLGLEHALSETIARRLLERQIKVGLTEDKALRFCPALNLTEAEIQRMVTVLREVAS